MFYTIYDSWKGSDTNVIELFFDLLPVLFDAMIQLGLRQHPTCKFAELGIKYV